MVDRNPEEWPSMLLNVLWAYRTTKRTSTWTTPFALNYGQDVVLPMEIVVRSQRVGTSAATVIITGEETSFSIVSCWDFGVSITPVVLTVTGEIGSCATSFEGDSEAKLCLETLSASEVIGSASLRTSADIGSVDFEKLSFKGEASVGFDLTFFPLENWLNGTFYCSSSSESEKANLLLFFAAS